MSPLLFQVSLVLLSNIPRFWCHIYIYIHMLIKKVCPTSVGPFQTSLVHPSTMFRVQDPEAIKPPWSCAAMNLKILALQDLAEKPCEGTHHSNIRIPQIFYVNECTQSFHFETWRLSSVMVESVFFKILRNLWKTCWIDDWSIKSHHGDVATSQHWKIAHLTWFQWSLQPLNQKWL